MKITPAPGYCECGKKTESSLITSYQTAHYDAAGKLVYAVCSHGVVILDERVVSLRFSRDPSQPV